MHDTLFMIGRQWQHRCTSRTVGLHEVNFTRLHACRHAGWAGLQGDHLVEQMRKLQNATSVPSRRHGATASVLIPPPPLPSRCCSQWDDRQNWHSTSGCMLTVTSMAGWKTGMLLAEHRLFILIIDHCFYKRTSINRCSFNIPSKNHARISYTSYSLKYIHFCGIYNELTKGVAYFGLICNIWPFSSTFDQMQLTTCAHI